MIDAAATSSRPTPSDLNSVCALASCAIRGPVTINQGPRTDDWSDASTGVKALAAFAILLCIAGLGLFGAAVLGDSDGAVDGDDRVRSQGMEMVVEGDDL